MNLHKQKIIKDFEKTYNRKIECSINKASNEIMLHRISGGKEIEFPFCSWEKKIDWLFINITKFNFFVIKWLIKQTLKFY